MIQFACTHCGQNLHAPELDAGQSGPCPKCGQPLTAPPVDPLLAPVWMPSEPQVDEPSALPESASYKKVVDPLKTTGLCALLVALVTLNHPLRARVGLSTWSVGTLMDWLNALGAFGIIVLAAVLVGSIAGGIARSRGKTFRSVMGLGYAIAVCVLTGAGAIAHVAQVNIQAAAYQQKKEHGRDLAPPIPPSAPPHQTTMTAPRVTPAPPKVAPAMLAHPTPRPAESSPSSKEVSSGKSRFDKLGDSIFQHASEADAEFKRLHRVADQAGVPAAAAQVEEMRRSLKDFVDTAKKLREQYRHELDAAGCSRLLDADRLAADKRFVESDRMVAGVRAAFGRHMSDLAALLTKWAPQMKAWGADDRTPHTAAQEEEWREDVRDMMTRVQAAAGLEKVVVDSLADAVRILKGAGDGWSARDHTVSFQRGSDAEQFNAVLARIHDAVARQTQLREMSSAKTEQLVEVLKKILPGS
jgi:hypothetical protein